MVNLKRFLKGVPIGIALFTFISCNKQLRIERADNKAVDRVLTKVSLLNKAGEVYMNLHPCVVDTIKRDTLIKTVTKERIVKVPFTLYKDYTFDTTINGVYIFVDSTGITVDGEFKEKVIRETKTVVDREKEKRLTDTLNSYLRSISALQATINELRESKSHDQISHNKQMWLAVLCSGFIIACLIAFIRFKL